MHLTLYTPFSNSDSVEDSHKVAPDHVHCRYVQTLVRAMHTAQSGTERHHVEARIFLAEQTALQTSMDATHDGFLAKQLDVCLSRNAQEFALRIHRPARITLGGDDLGTSQLLCRANDLGYIFAGRLDTAALRGGHHNLALCHFLDAGKIA